MSIVEAPGEQLGVQSLKDKWTCGKEKENILLYDGLVELTQDLCGGVAFIHHVLTEETMRQKRVVRDSFSMVRLRAA
ncbi:hypothetical protein EYF80_011862 [Liparis tanakae]|uniref:Uncharacterized protein n=1 Tax=Liparis tanakae TaxID=230148 RepID=A0A4Z2IIY8_9TELE|nr:hypothetical protein EYF80_011862 [Liparis tanakae]